jgi:UDP-N-acetyl-D-mannosaminuronic acid dehydrogenase
VLATDPYVADPTLVPLKQVLEESDLLVLAAPHRDYVNLATTKPVVDIWNCIRKEGE